MSEDFTPLEEYNGKLKVDFMGMKVTMKYVGSTAINKEQTIGKIGIAPEQALKTTIFYSIDQEDKEIITTSGENEGQSSSDKKDIVMLNASASTENIYQKHLSRIQGKTIKKLEKFAKKAKKIGGGLACLTSNPESTIGKLSDITILVKGKSKDVATTEISLAPYTSLFDISCLSLFDSLGGAIMAKLGQTEKDIDARHATVE